MTVIDERNDSVIEFTVRAVVVSGIVVVLAICGLLYRAGRSGDEGAAEKIQP